MYESLSQTLGPHWRGMVVRGVLSVVFGVLAMAWPDVTVDVLVLLIGAWIVATVLEHVVAAVASRREHKDLAVAVSQLAA